MNRRSFLALSTCAFSSLLLPRWAWAARPPLSILQGLTDAQSTQLSIVVPAAETFDYQIIGGPRSVISVEHQQISRSFSNWAVDRLVITGLEPHQEYLLIVADAFGNEIDRRTFRSLDLLNDRARFAFVSCMNDQMESQAVWDSLVADRPQVLFMVGDSVYADQVNGQTKAADPEQLWRRFVETRNSVPFYFSRMLIPTVATWDDHDFGINNGNRTHPYVNEAQEIFLSFFAQAEGVSSSLTRGPGVSSLFRAFGQNFFLLDDRSFRTEAGAQDPTHWGPAQEAWIAEKAKAFPQPTWLFNGSQFFGAYKVPGESVEADHPASLERLRMAISQLPQPFVMGSGDVHFSEIMNIEESWLGYPTVELVSSSMHSVYFPDMDQFFANPRRMKSVAEHNYMLVDSTVLSSSALQISARSRGANGQEYFAYQGEIVKPANAPNAKEILISNAHQRVSY